MLYQQNNSSKGKPIRTKLFAKHCDITLFSSVCYSNLYFKSNKSLFGRIIQSKDVQFSNNILFQLDDVVKTSKSYKYMPVFKRNILCDFPGVLITDFRTLIRTTNVYNNVRTKIDESSYANYTPMIHYNTLTFTEFYPRRSISFKVSRVCYSPNNVITKKLKRKDLANLDEISPVDVQSPTKRFPPSEDVNRTKKGLIFEPLLLQDVSYKYSEKFRQKQQDFNKNVRLMILYSFLCFVLAIIVFLTLYLT